MGHARACWARRTVPSRRCWVGRPRRRTSRCGRSSRCPASHGESARAEEGADAVDGATPGPRLRPPACSSWRSSSATTSRPGTVSMGAKKGKVVVEFSDLGDLERLYRLMTGGS